MTDEQNNSDPLPYTQVDRAVKQTAAVIGSKLGVSFQHALGGLVQFWEMNGDPRDLEAMLAAGKHEVTVERDEVARRFALAMAVDTSSLDPDDLATLRLLERLSDGTYRVRGMSRYLKPLQRRTQARAAAAAGGKASAKARAAKHGTAQPRSGAASATASGVASEPLRETTPEARSDTDPRLEAPPNTAVSGQRSSSKTASVAPARLGPADLVFTHWQTATGHTGAKFDDKRRRAVKARLGEGYTVDQLKQAVDGCLRTPHNMGKNDRGEVYDDLELICRDGPHVDRFIRNAAGPPTAAGGNAAATGPKVVVIR